MSYVHRSARAVLCLTVLTLLSFSAGGLEENREELYERYLTFSAYAQGKYVEPIWMSDGDGFCYSRALDSGRQFFLVDPVSNTQEPFFDVPRLRDALAELLPEGEFSEGVPFEAFEFVQDDRAIQFDLNGSRFLLSLDAYALKRVPPAPPERRPRTRPGKHTFPTVEEPSPDGEQYVGSEDHNLYLRSSRGGETRKITIDGVEDFEWELSAWMGPPVLWSPNGKLIAAKKTDYRVTPKVPLVDYLDPHHATQWIPYWTAFDPIPLSHLYFIDLASTKLTPIEGTGHSADWSVMLRWSPDSRELYFVRMHRSFRKLDLLVADTETGRSRVILTEAANTRRLADPASESVFTPLRDGKRFIWLSGRDGRQRLYLYDFAGRLVRALTRDDVAVVRLVEVDEEHGWIYFTARGDAHRPYDTHLYRVDLQGKRLTQLTKAPGQHDPGDWSNPAHSIRFSPSGKFFLDTHSTPVRPHSVDLRRNDGTLVRTLVTADLTLPAELKWRPPEEFQVTAADGSTPLEGILYHPHDFDPDKRYPVIAFIYGTQGSVPRTFDSNWIGRLAQAMAQQQFVTFVLDVRGASSFWPGGSLLSKDARDDLDGKVGKVAVEDHVAALEQLGAERAYLDLDRVGVHGGSFGGYMALHAILTRPEVFKVAVAVAAISDQGRHWFNYARIGTPELNPQGYEYSSNIRLAGNLEGKLLLIHGTHDVPVPLSHALRMADALIEADKPFDLLIMPGTSHFPALLGYGNQAAVRYFREHLGSPDQLH
jgi:dipeptidyl aminopeptidase/acylaminoacyl peptidase